MPDNCPTCRSSDPNVCATNCYNPWHRGLIVHFQKEPIGTPGTECHAACSTPIEDPPSQLAVDAAFVSCHFCHAVITTGRAEHGTVPFLTDRQRFSLRCIRDFARSHLTSADAADQNRCDRGLSWLDDLLDGEGSAAAGGPPAAHMSVWKAPVIRRHQELADTEIDRATPDNLRAAYRSLREHHIAETTALAARRDDINRRRDALLEKNKQVLAHSQWLMENANRIMQSDEETIDRLGNENARLAEIIDFMQNRYSPIGGRGCALCVYVEGRFIRACAFHRWGDTFGQRILAPRKKDPAKDLMPAYLSDDELTAWKDGFNPLPNMLDALEGTYLGLVLAELRERRDAEAMFADADLQLQRIASCETCAADTHATDDEHREIVKRWRIAQGALCALARIHRGYLRSLDEPDEGSPP